MSKNQNVVKMNKLQAAGNTILFRLTQEEWESLLEKNNETKDGITVAGTSEESTKNKGYRTVYSAGIDCKEVKTGDNVVLREAVPVVFELDDYIYVSYFESAVVAILKQ